MQFLKHFLIRLLIVAVPLTALYFYAQMAFKANRQKEHPTDVGLGIALLLCAVLMVLGIALLTDLIVRIAKKQYTVALSNIPFLLLFLIPILYIACNMSSYCEDCFCNWVIETYKKFNL